MVYEPERLPPSRSELGMRHAVMIERVARLEKATELQAREYARRLEDLNHAHERNAAVLAQSVTAEKFEDYTEAQKQALRLAFDAATARTDALAQRNSDRIEALVAQVLRLEDQVQYQVKTEDRTLATGNLQRDFRTRWLIAIAGFAITLIFLSVDVVLALTHK